MLALWVSFVLIIIFVNIRVKIRLVILHIGMLYFPVGFYLAEVKGESIGELLMALGFILFCCPPLMAGYDLRSRMFEYVYNKSKKNPKQSNR